MSSNYIQHYRCSVDSSSRGCSVRDALKFEVVGRYGTSCPFRTDTAAGQLATSSLRPKA